MSGTIMPSPWFTGLDDNGVTVIGGKLYTYAAGTSTPLATYADSDLTVPNANPTILDGGGRATLYLPATSYKFVLKDANDVTIRTQDNISATAPFNADLNIAGVAGENIPAGSVVYLSSGAGGTTEGRWYLADADFDFSSSTAGVVAMVQNAIIAGAVGSIRLQGRTFVPGPLTVGSTYFVSPTAGGLVTPSPVGDPPFARLVGVADGINTIVSATGLGNINVVAGDINVSGNLAVDGQTSLNGDLVFVANNAVRRNTADAADTGFISLAGGGAPGRDRGASAIIYGNEHATSPGILALSAGAAAGKIEFRLSTADPNEVKGVMFPNGGFAWGSDNDPGPRNLAVAGNIDAVNLNWNQPHTWSVLGDVTALNFLPGMCLPVRQGQSASLVGARGRIHNGGSVTAVIYVAGTNIGSVVVTPTLTTTVFNHPLVNDTEILLQLTNPVAAPTNFSLTLYIRYNL